MGKDMLRRSTAATRTMVLRFVALCVGYGAFHSSCYNGVLRRAFLSGMGLGTEQAWTTIALLLGGTGVGCLAMRALHRRGVHLVSTFGACVGYAIVACLDVLTCLGAPSASTAYLSAVVCGLATSLPLLLWFKAFLHVYRTGGPSACMLGLACGTLLGYVPICFVGGIHQPAVGLAALLAGTALAALGQMVFFHSLDMPTAESSAGSVQGQAPYRLSVYIVVLVASFGAATGLASGVTFFLGNAGGEGDSMVQLAAAALACLTFVGLSLQARKGLTLHFGLLIRFTLVMTGVVFAFAAVLYAHLAILLTALCQAVTIVQGIAMTVLSIEICHERNLEMSDVMPANYAVYIVFLSCGMGLTAWAGFNGGELVWQLVFAAGATSVVAAILALPSTSSSAATFTEKTLLENERYEERTSRVCMQTAARYGLTPRETDVLELLLLGRTRAQIADSLALSTWTVKEYVSDIYSKVGVHSAKDLMVSCMAQAGSPKEK